MAELPLSDQYSEHYNDLRRLAHAQLSRHERNDALDTTALVHESFLKFVNAGGKTEDRRHFLAYAAKVMRSVIVDYARAQLAEKRGGQEHFITLNSEVLDVSASDDGILRIHEALAELESVDERLCRIVELRFFVGLPTEEVCDVLSISPRTLFREWEKARLILLDALRGEPSHGAGA